MLRAAVLVMVSSVLFAGCSLYRVDSKDVSSDFYPPKNSADQVVYLEKVDKPYEVIGRVKITTDRMSPREEIVAKMRYEAAILGADAVTDITSDRAPFRVEYTAKAVVFK
jgi:hypothetical protein